MATRIPIPLGQQRQSTPLGMPAARAPMVAVEDPTGRAVAGLGQAVGQIGDAVKRQQKEDAIAWVSKASSDDQIKWMQRMVELQETAEAGAPDFTPRFIKEFDDYAAQAVENAPEFARAAYRESLTRQRTQFGGNAISFEATKRSEYIVSQYGTGLDSDSRSIALEPSLYDERRALRLAALNESTLPASVKTKLIGDAEATMAYAAGAAMIDRDPHGAVAAMEAASRGEAVNGFRWISRLDSDRIQQLRTRAQTQADRIDNKARIEQDKADARGQRAIGEIDRQISTGVPATADDMLRWACMVAGTDYEQSYRDMLKGQQEVQDVLRMPIAEQQAYVLQRRMQQQTAGANPTAIANLDRVERAIQSSSKLLQENPLAWVEQRAAQPVAPLDLTLLASQDGIAVVGQQLRDRSDVIRGMQSQNPPGVVSMRPLLDAEAQTLTNAFKEGNARQKREVLGALYWAAGEPDTFQGIVEQVDGINPFMARMGRLASSFEQSKLTNYWFSEDVVQSAGDAAATAIHGDEILRAGGKAGTISYPVPKDNEFVQALEEKVQDLYRGLSAGSSAATDFMQDTYAIKAYYVGKAAQDGSLAPDVDTDRLDQAITAVIGAPVDFNGQGRVLAPWGMDSDSFTARANSAINRQIQERQLGSDLIQSADNIGLIAVGSGVYAATLGDQPLMDPSTGDLIIIEMSPDADSGRDSFGVSASDLIPRQPSNITGATE
ncbi:hypothetical protein NBV64_05920 [Alcaligenes sp. DN25]|uniref:hypothetical protein n=1 Tax=Alcaligenes TaxID=507 RepID=UPI002030BC89|nr:MULTISPECIES: hypothetical protein [Alcaligenes]URW83889.1 hypothetical protein NBV64_05920 [Alcaligenes sp. DN25]WEA68727.1 hypothetical protein PWH35_05930 [Alcaligenes faecalis]